MNRVTFRPRRVCGGFTLVEILLALGLTGLIAAGASTMLFSVSLGTTSEAEIRRTTVKEKVIGLRMSNALGASKMVLDHGTDYLVLWMGDQRDNGVPDLSELRRIERDGVTHQLTSYRAPLNLSDANNTTYGFVDDFGLSIQAIS